jgi:hypothetical protein
MSGEFADKADKYNDTIHDMQSAFKGLGLALADDVLPAMTSLAEKMTTVVTNAGSVLRVFTMLGRMDDASWAGFLAKVRLLGNLATGNVGGAVGELLGGQPTPFLRQGPPLSGKGTATTSPPTAAEIAAAKAAADQRAIDRALAISVGMPGVVGEGGFPKMGMPGAAGTLKGEKAFGLADVVDAQLTALGEKLKARGEALRGVAMGVAESISGALADGFNSAFSGDDNFFAALGKSLLSSLGNILVQIGASMVTYGALMTPLAGIPGPWQALGLGAMASLAAGIGLMALGAGMGAIGGGSKGGGAGGSSDSRTPKTEQDEFSVAFDPDKKLRRASGAAVQPSARGLSNAPMPEGRAPIVFAPTIIGRDDLQMQRQLKYMVEKASGRGITGR